MIQPLPQAALDQHNALLAAVIDGSAVSFAIADARDPALPLIYVNEAFTRLSGYSREESIGRNCRFLSAEERDSPGRSRLRETVEARGAGSFEVLNCRKDGSLFMCAITVFPVHGADGRAHFMVATQTDVSEARTMELERNAARDRLVTALSSARQGFVVVDPQGRIVLANAGWSEFHPIPSDGWAVRSSFQQAWKQYRLAQGSSPDEAARDAAERVSALFNGGPEREVRSASGRVALLTDRPTSDGGAISTLVDITKQKATEDRLAEQVAAIEASDDGMAITDPEGNFVYMNHSHARMFGFADGKDPLGLPWSSLYSPEEVARLQQVAFPVLGAEGRWRGEATGRRIDGEPVQQEVALSLRANGGIVCNTRDVGKRREAEREKARLREQLLVAQRQEAIGQLASGIAHDFNNLLAAVSGSAALILAGTDEGAKRHAERIMSAVGMAASLVSKMLSLGARKSDRREVELGATIRNAVELLRANLPSNQQIDLVLPAQPLVAVADPAEVMQVVLNLVINARDALPGDGGRIAITLHGAEDLVRDAVFVVGGQPAGPAALLTVSDTGCGIAPADISRIFQPFFTQKGAAGTGLGLAVVAGIVADAGGGIALETAAGQGTSFHVLWPLDAITHLPSGPPLQAASLHEALKGKGVLIVDDNPTVVELLREMLEQVGAEVGPSLDPADTLQALREDPAAWSLLITDFDMPSMTGADLALQARQLRPELAILLCTALPEAHGDFSATATLFDAIIGKPVSADSLLTAAEAAISAHLSKANPCES